MLRSTFYSFTTALRGLTTAQKQLDVTGQNISNVNTTGYTRQRADTYATTAAGYGDKYTSSVNNSLAGQGAAISGISQARDPFLDVRFRREASALGEEDAKLSCMEDISANFDEIQSSGIMNSFKNFISKLQSFSNNASSSTFNSITRDAAAEMVNQLKSYSSQLNTVREHQEYQLKDVTVNKVNSILSNIANINDSIQSQELSGGNALELKDERNLLLDELSSYVKLEVSYTENKLSNNTSYNDISISMVGADGTTKTPLVYNNSAATFSAALPGEKDATGAIVQEAVLTIDNSAIEVKKISDKVNKAISNIASINDKLSTVFAKYSTNAADYNTALADSNTALPTAQLAYDTENAKPIKNLTVLAALSKTVSDLKTKILDLGNVSGLLSDRGTQENTIKSSLGATKVTLVNGDTNSDLKIDISEYSLTLSGTAQPLISAAKGTSITRTNLENAGIKLDTYNITANKAQSPGALKGALDMLNSEGCFDYNNNEIRGIGYYENMLDSLANKFATDFNTLNSTTFTNANGDQPLFEAIDKTKPITASNIQIASGWREGTYSITTSKKPTTDNATGNPENILAMIAQCNSKSEYKTSKIAYSDSYGNYYDTSNVKFADGRDSEGNYTLKFADPSGLKYNADGSVGASAGIPVTPPYTVGTSTYTKDAAGNYVIKKANADLIDYKLDGINLNAPTIYVITPTPPDGTTFSDGTNTTLTKDSKGDYYLGSVKHANSAGIAYKADGTLNAVSSMIGRDENFLYNGTYQEFLANIANVTSLDVSSTSNLLANHTKVVEDIQDSKDSVSSVSLDEEGINLMQYQKAYNAAARLMTTLDEAIESIINMGTVGR